MVPGPVLTLEYLSVLMTEVGMAVGLRVDVGVGMGVGMGVDV